MARGKTIGLWILKILAAAAFLGAGSGKLMSSPDMVAVFQNIGMGQGFRYLTGLLEVVGAVGLLIPATAFYAAVLLALVMVGAVATHLFVIGGSPVAALVLLVVVSAIAWLSRTDRKRV